MKKSKTHYIFKVTLERETNSTTHILHISSPSFPSPDPTTKGKKNYIYEVTND